jgi:molybdopterin synthase sulfur carrier subunit
MAKILYFATLVDQLGRASEELTLPGDVRDVRGLLGFLRARGGAWEQALAEAAIKVTVDRQFANADTGITDRSEIALVGARPW